MTCTWKDCVKPARVPQFDKQGEKWADLCHEHDAKLDAAIASPDPKLMLKYWVLASGGPSVLAGRMLSH